MQYLVKDNPEVARIIRDEETRVENSQILSQVANEVKNLCKKFPVQK